jgi:hypothetical protein
MGIDPPERVELRRQCPIIERLLCDFSEGHRLFPVAPRGAPGAAPEHDAVSVRERSLLRDGFNRATVSVHEEKKMTIEFTGRRHVVAASRVAFEAKVSGKEVWCSVSMDALNDHFGNTGTSSHELIQSFEANRPRIEAAAQRVLERNGGQSVELETRDLD